MKYNLVLISVLKLTNSLSLNDNCTDAQNVCMKCSRDRMNGFIKRGKINLYQGDKWVCHVDPNNWNEKLMITLRVQLN